ncbi:hypothetical protein KL909_002110 [Ogataea angusta]|nr:hypothetical protein KL909_002110 [Ogataea angusta]
MVRSPFDVSDDEDDPFSDRNYSRLVNRTEEAKNVPVSGRSRHAPSKAYPPVPNVNEVAKESAYNSTTSSIPESRQRGALYNTFFGGRERGWPYFTYFVSLIQVVVFIYELVKMGIYTKTVFQTKPYFNPMLGPSSYVQINVGARYLPCMTTITGYTDNEQLEWPCPNSTSTSTDVCSLEELCGMGVGFSDGTPRQWWRLFTSIFIHAGFIHIIFNLLLQVALGSKVERYIGLLRYAFIYVAAGMGGSILGANFLPAGMASSGASGALCGACVAMNLILLIYNNNIDHYDPRLKGRAGRKLFVMMLVGSVVEVIIIFVLGLLPGIDNFAHIGGFVIGIVLGTVLLDSPSFVYEQDGQTRKPLIFFTWIFVRVVCLALTIAYFALLSKNFADKGAEASDSCKWCKYINCLPVNGWCELGDLSATSS